MSSRKLARELGISRSSVHRTLKNDLKPQAHKIQNEPVLTDEFKAKRLKFANWLRKKFPERRYDEDSIFRREIVRH